MADYSSSPPSGKLQPGRLWVNTEERPTSVRIYFAGAWWTMEQVEKVMQDAVERGLMEELNP